MVTVEIDKPFQKDLSPGDLQRLAGQVFALLEIAPKAGLSIRISNNTTLQQLNLEYLGVDAPTDVLSFPVEFDDPEGGGRYYGDILISFEKAAAQAAASGHSTIDEIRLLIVHGILHLLGYDHAEPDQKREMWSLQSRLLTELGIEAAPTE